VSQVNELGSAVSEILIDEETLHGRIAELGAQISEDYRGQDLLLIGVLKGAIFFMADLMRQIEVPCEVDFMAISSYGAGVDSSGVVRILKDLDVSIEGRHARPRRSSSAPSMPSTIKTKYGFSASPSPAQRPIRMRRPDDPGSRPAAARAAA